MATFTQEEVDLVKSRGNNYCRQTWLGLYEQKLSAGTKDEQEIKDFMIDKYERKRFYLDPSNLRNGTIPPPQKEVKPLKSILTNSQNKDLQIKNSFNAKTNGMVATDNGSDFVADFGSADIFSAPTYNNNNSNGTTQPSFANFDNNFIFNATSPFTNSTPAPPKPIAPPAEDKYAALKDLDNALKQQQEGQVEWNNGSSNGSGYASSPQSGSLYGSPSNTGSLFGSPSQGQFISAFQPQDLQSPPSNPFQRAPAPAPIQPQPQQNPWGPVNGNANGSTVIANNFQGFGANPFRTDSFNGNKFNGVSNGFGGQMAQPFQQNVFPSSQIFPNKAWNTPNPFTLSTVTPGNNGHSNNPFL